jgi:anti-sigma factor RsiW
VTESHEELRELLGAHALGALAPEEDALVRAHVAVCPECARQAQELAATVALLGPSVTSEPLPSGFGDEVLGRIRGEAPQARARPGARARRAVVLRGHALSYAALALALAVLGAGLVDARREQQRDQQLIRALVQRQGMSLRGPQGAVGRMVPTSDGAFFVVAGLPPAPEDRTYQLWLLRDNCGGVPCEPASAGTFDTSEGFAVVATDRPSAGLAGAAVTIEPAGGSRRPTSRPVISTT